MKHCHICEDQLPREAKGKWCPGCAGLLVHLLCKPSNVTFRLAATVEKLRKEYGATVPKQVLKVAE